jgi:glycine hydroxymethyltransferase
MVFPGIQGGPLMHVIAGKAICLYEALQPEFRLYQEQVLLNAKTLAEGLKNHGYKIISNGTDNHLVLVDVSVKNLTGKECQIALDLAGITINKNTIPFDTKSPFQASGIRLGTPAITTRGMKETEVKIIVDLIDKVLNNINDEIIIKNVHNQIKELTTKFPLIY